MLTIIYPYTNLTFPSRMANAFQIVSTSHAMAKTGKASVHFILRNPKKWTPAEILRYYGLDECSNLHIHSITTPYTAFPLLEKFLNLVFKLKLNAKVVSLFRENPRAILYGRDINILNLFARFKQILGIRIAYEAHTIQSWFLRNRHTWDSNISHFPRWKAVWYTSKEKRVLEKVDFVFTVTRKLLDVLVNQFGVDEKKVHVAHDATRVVPLNASNSIGIDRKRVVGYVGQLNTSRGVDVLIRAMKYLADGTELMVVGGGNEKHLKRLKSLSCELGLTERITFTGYVEPTRVKDYLAKMDILAMPHLDHIHITNFASPLKLFEYMAQEKPIIATNLLSTREILRDGENAVLVKPNDPQALASGIKLVFENRELARRIAKNAYEEVCEKYTWGKRAEKILSILCSYSETQGH